MLYRVVGTQYLCLSSSLISVFLWVNVLFGHTLTNNSNLTASVGRCQSKEISCFPKL